MKLVGSDRFSLDWAEFLETVQRFKNSRVPSLQTARIEHFYLQAFYVYRYVRTVTTMNGPASQGHEPFSVQHDRFRNTLGASDLEDFANLSDDTGKITFVYGRLYEHADQTFPGAGSRDESTKNGDKAMEMKKTGNCCFQKSDYRNAVNWYSLAVLNCPQTEGIHVHRKRRSRLDASNQITRLLVFL